MRAAIYEADDVWMPERGGDINLSNETLDGLLANGDFREQCLNRHGLSRLLIARKHDASHAAAPQNFYHLIAGDRLRLSLQLVAAVFAQKNHTLGRGRGFGLITPPAV